jgi:hypothetical protein
MNAFRLAWRLERLELSILIALSLVLAVVSFVVAWQLGLVRDELTACYRTAPDSAVAAWPCRSIDERHSQLMIASGLLTAMITAAPFGLGILLGAPAIARELEGRTAPIAWSLSPSRVRWLALRVVPLVLIVGGVLLLLGGAGESLGAATNADGLGFPHLGAHGPLVAARGLAVLALGVVIGLLVGRVLPAILVTALLTAALFAGVTLARTAVMEAESEWIEITEMSSLISYVHESALRDDASGEMITWEEAYERFPEAFGPTGDQQPPGMTIMSRVVLPSRYPWFVVREAALLSVLTVALGAVAVVAIRSRRPE